jgi:aspartyl-tRNA(Asn)/glutamyl-tRNA(Gln) amidotransferase subunit C
MSVVLDPQTVKKIAHLARLSKDPSPEFLEKYGKELGEVLEYVQQLKEVDTSNIDPLDGFRTISIHELREDEYTTDQELYQQIRSRILANFPTRQGDLLVIPGIFDDN